MKKVYKTLFICLLVTATLSQTHTMRAQDTAPKKEEIIISKAVLETYVGKYQMGADTLNIIMDGAEIKAKGPGYPPLELKARKENLFLLKQFGVDIEFVKGEDGKIEKLLMIRADGQQLEAPKID